MAVKMPDLVAYGERVNKTQNNSGGVQMPNLVAYGKRVETRKAKETKAVTPSASPRPMENASTGNSRPNSRLLADVRTGGTTPPSLDNGRVGKVISGAAKSVGSAYTNLGGVLAEGAGKLNTRIANQNAGDSLQSDHDAVKRYEKMLRDVKWANGKAMTAADVKQVQSYLSAAKRRIAAHEGYTKAVERSNKAVADKAYQKADRLSQSSAADVAQAKEGLGPVGQFAVDLGVQGVQMAGDVAASAVIPGAGLALMTARSAGSSAQRARQAGATYNQQLAYGLGSGALSLATEKISNVASPFKKAFGGGVLDNAISGALSKLNNNAAGRVALSMISEGGEEFLEDVFQPVLQRATYDPSARFDLSEALYDAAVGAAMGGIGAGADVIRQRGNGQADAQPTQEVRPEVREGTYTPTPANAAEGAQNAAPGVETAVNENGLNSYSEQERVNLSSGKKNKVISTLQDAVSFVRNALSNKQNVDRAYLGKVPDRVAQKVLTDTGVDIRGMGAMMNGNDVRHIMKDHGDPIAETARGQVPVTPDDIARIPEVISAPDRVTVSPETDSKGRTALVFEKQIGDKYITIQGVSDGKHVLQTDTLYIRKGKTRTAQDTMLNTSMDAAPVINARSELPQSFPNLDSNIAQGAENVKNGGAAGFDTPGDAVAGAVNTPFDTMQAKSEEFYPVNPNSAERVQNDQRRAPSEVPVVNPDTGRNVEKTVSTILNSPLTSPEMATVYENAIAGGAFDYDVVTDRSAVQQAQAKIARDGWREVANSFIAKAELGQQITKADTAEAISAYNLAISEGDHKAAFELATAIADAAHDSAQMVQAMNLMNRLTPEGRLLTLRRLVDKMNDRAARQNRTPRQSTPDSGDVEGARVDYIDKVTGFTLSDELATNYLMAETDAERAAAWDAITTSIADQIPSTFMEKANFWRYTSMLTNPTTHIRNIMGNAIQFGARKIKDGIGTAIERAVIKDQSQRTKAVNVDKDLKAFAKGQYETDQSAAMGSGKYSDATTAAGIEREIQSKRKMFNGEDVLSRAVQGIGDLNSRALDYEDVIFNRAAYVDSFAQALQAKGVTAAEAHAGTRAADVETARAYAIEEAQRATYRNTTALSEALSKMGRYQGDNQVLRAASFAADAFLPFRKTPANILTTGLDYSPIGLIKGIKEAMVDVKSGKCTAADAVDSLASGLTGTGILALGAYMVAQGLFGATLHVRAGDDDKEEAFEKSMGGQDYAIQIGDKSYTLDWMTPAAMPLFAGAAIMESVQKGGGTFDALVDSLLGMQDVVLETSMLSSLNDLVSNISYAKSKPMYLIDRAASSYAGQYIPTIGSKVASVFDDTVRKSYVEKGSGQVASDVNYFLQGAAKKVPGARNQLQPMVDIWGNEVSNGSAPERVFQSFFSPGVLKAQDNSPATQEIRRLAKATGDSTVYPAAAEKSYTVKGEIRTLTGEEYTRYAKTMGQTRKELVEAAVKLPAYKSMSNAEKADYIQNVYKYARETARQQVDPKYEPSAKWIENAKTSKRDIGVSTGEFLALYQKYGSEKMSGKAYEKVKQAHDAGLSPKEYFSMKDRADADGNGRVSKAEASAALAGQENRADLWDIICTTNAKNPYK
nr:MAG TPA: nuclease [Caudoviricetes sp.]